MVFFSHIYLEICLCIISHLCISVFVLNAVHMYIGERF